MGRDYILCYIIYFSQTFHIKVLFFSPRFNCEYNSLVSQKKKTDILLSFTFIKWKVDCKKTYNNTGLCHFNLSNVMLNIYFTYEILLCEQIFYLFRNKYYLYFSQSIEDNNGISFMDKKKKKKKTINSDICENSLEYNFLLYNSI